MKIFPAIDLYGGNVVRLTQGDYNKMTVYSDDPVAVAREFELTGAKYLHLVDLEGAKTGQTSNLKVIGKIIENTNLFVQLGGGIRSVETAEMYLSGGVNRIILGTSAYTDTDMLIKLLKRYGERIAVGIDIIDGCVAIKGWTLRTKHSTRDFCEKMQILGVNTIICTDISKDGEMSGINKSLYEELTDKFTMNIIASGGISTISDVQTLANMKLYGAIIGKAYYTGVIDLSKAIEVAGE